MPWLSVQILSKCLFHVLWGLSYSALCRYGLVRVRENAESIAFYGGEAQEQQLLMRRLQRVVENNGSLIITTRNLEFFTSFYR